MPNNLWRLSFFKMATYGIAHFLRYFFNRICFCKYGFTQRPSGVAAFRCIFNQENQFAHGHSFKVCSNPFLMCKISFFFARSATKLVYAAPGSGNHVKLRLLASCVSVSQAIETAV